MKVLVCCKNDNLFFFTSVGVIREKLLFILRKGGKPKRGVGDDKEGAEGKSQKVEFLVRKFCGTGRTRGRDGCWVFVV